MVGGSLVGRLRHAAGTLLPTDRRGNSYALTLITPIVPGAAPDLRSVLESFGSGKESPLARLEDVHFARWVIVGQLLTDWDGAPKRPSVIESEYLLFSADLTAKAPDAAALPGSFLNQLAEIEESREVWKHCVGFPATGDSDAVAKYLDHGRIQIDLYYAAFPDLTPAEIAHAIKVRRQFADFVLSHQEALSDPSAAQSLRDDYLRESALWPS
jgi:hypothetical protein